jgi:2-C-methyl-D-erythritol 4-phosphate cytidylyltransferase / 2-C-methyl-D-erythritol 2,4-cyclodiphosphate synthase
MPDTIAILVAAGRGERLGGPIPKAFVPLAGAPMMLHAARAFTAAASVGGMIAVVPEDRREQTRALLSGSGKLHGVAAGGARRQDSVQAGLALLEPGFSGVVLVHDAARPLVDADLIERVAVAARRTGAAVPVMPLPDTIKRISGSHVAGTIDRGALGAAQTPQGFRRDVLGRAYEAAFREGLEVTDEAMAVERLGEPVEVVEGSARNRKVTAPDDLAWAEWMLGGGGSRFRVGNGFDVHRLVEGRPLMLGGVCVPHARGLEGHSDGDCVVHAVCDALLGAAASGDMGRYFPSDDPRWRGTASLVFLEEVVRLVSERHEIANVDVTVVAQQPRLAPYTEAMRAALSRCLQRPTDAVSVKAKTADGLGVLGAGDGIAAQATVLLRERRA